MIDIQHGDCVELLPYFRGGFDLIVTSPPYDNIREYAGKSEFDFDATAPLLVSSLRQGGVLCWNVYDQIVDGGYSLTSARNAIRFQELGLRCMEQLVFHKAHPRTIGTVRYLPTHEYVWVFARGKPRVFNPLEDRINIHAGDYRPNDRAPARSGDAKAQTTGRPRNINPKGRRTTIWRYTTGWGQTAPDAVSLHDVHPAMMPLRLAQDLIRSYSDEGDLVLDPFGGVGTTAKAAQYLLRDCVSIDINEDYCVAARVRCSQAVLT